MRKRSLMMTPFKKAEAFALLDRGYVEHRARLGKEGALVLSAGGTGGGER